MSSRVAILGAGPSGLAQLRAFETAQRNGADIPEIVCFERQQDWGGQWNYTWRTGTDQNGEPVHSSMYRYLWSNGPKECLEFSDYSFEEHFGRPIPSYPPRAVLLDYIIARVEKSDVRKYIRFNTAVRWVSFNKETKKFKVTVMDYTKDRVSSEEFDYVVVATGHFSVPNVPEFNGFDRFNGRVLHAHNFRDAREFSGQNVLMIGSSYSAEDIGSQCLKYGAKKVTFSYRTNPLGFEWPEECDEVPLVTSIDGNTVTFKDGSSADYDAIVLCTGYLHHHPFLPDDMRLTGANVLYPANLYKGIFWLDNPQLMYLGMQDQYYTFNMFDVQAWYARDVMMGKESLPSYEVMAHDANEWLARQEALATHDDEIDFQAAYIRDIQGRTDYPEFDVEGQGEIFKSWLKDKEEDIMGFRNKCYTSTMTGTTAPGLPMPWMDIKDDSLESFMRITDPNQSREAVVN